MIKFTKEQINVLNTELRERGIEHPLDLSVAIKLVEDLKDPSALADTRDRAKGILSLHLSDTSARVAIYLGISELLCAAENSSETSEKVKTFFEKHFHFDTRGDCKGKFEKYAEAYEVTAKDITVNIDLEAESFASKRFQVIQELMVEGKIELDLPLESDEYREFDRMIRERKANGASNGKFMAKDKVENMLAAKTGDYVDLMRSV